jgi:septal ring factor EnvC (AmiA/AmiB activator)
MTLNPSVATLFHEAERLDKTSLDTFIDHILSLRIQRETSDQQKEEAILLKKINKSLSLEQIERFKFLNQKRIESEITELEFSELTYLLDKLEKLNVNRLKYLTALSRLRSVSVRDLIHQLGLTNNLNG